MWGKSSRLCVATHGATQSESAMLAPACAKNVHAHRNGGRLSFVRAEIPLCVDLQCPVTA